MVRNGDGGAFAGDRVLAAAMPGRSPRHGHVARSQGDSCRRKEERMAGIVRAGPARETVTAGPGPGRPGRAWVM